MDPALTDQQRQLTERKLELLNPLRRVANGDSEDFTWKRLWSGAYYTRDGKYAVVTPDVGFAEKWVATVADLDSDPISDDLLSGGLLLGEYDTKREAIAACEKDRRDCDDTQINESWHLP